MVEKIKFENSTGKNMQICIEPLAEYVDWPNGKTIEIQFSLISGTYTDENNFAITDNMLIVYECRKYEMKIFIDRDLIYATPPELLNR